jgi:hypothetical protein
MESIRSTWYLGQEENRWGKGSYSDLTERWIMDLGNVLRDVSINYFA